MSIMLFLSILLLFPVSIAAQTTSATCNTDPSVTTLDPNCCVKDSGITAFPNCNYADDTVSKCNSPAIQSGAEAISCFCNQALLNAIYGCESEQRLCFGNADEDAQIQSEIDLWHSACDGRISFTPTTPPISSITAPYSQAYCNSIGNECASASLHGQECFHSSTDVSQFSSCLCQPTILANQYSCEVIGNISCLQLPATVSNMAAYTLCGSTFLEVASSINASANSNAPGSSPASTTASSSGTTTTSVSSFTPTKPFIPSSTSSSTTSTTSAASASSFDYVIGLVFFSLFALGTVISF